MLVVPRRAAVFRDHGCIYVNPGSALTITAALIYAMRRCLLTALALSFGSTVLGRLRFCAGIDGRAAGMGKVAKGSVSRTTARPPVRRACGFCRALNRVRVTLAVQCENPNLRCKSTSRNVQPPVKDQQAGPGAQAPLLARCSPRRGGLSAVPSELPIYEKLTPSAAITVASRWQPAGTDYWLPNLLQAAPWTNYRPRPR